MPNRDTIAKTYDFLDVSRGSQAFLAGIPAASVYAILEGCKAAGMNPGDMGVTEQLFDARSLHLTPNTTTVYCMTELNLKDGPMVMEIPTGVLGPVGDAYFRRVTDVGMTGPDQGQRGKYLLVHNSCKGEIPPGCFVVKAPTYRYPAFFRVIVQKCDFAAAVHGVKESFRRYGRLEPWFDKTWKPGDFELVK